VLGLASLGVLTYFIHHLAHSIQIGTIMSTVEREARWIIDDLYPDRSGYLELEEHCPEPPASAVMLPAGRSGYIQAVQPDSPVRAAARHDLVVRLARQVGDHVVEATPLAWAWPRSADRARLDPQLLQTALGDAVSIGFERTMVQDVPFGLRRLVDIGNKALSPAINDPYTGIQAVHHLSVLLSLLAGRRLGDRLYHDEQGTLRVAVPLPQFADYLRLGTTQIRRSGAKEPGGRPQPHPAVQGCRRPCGERGPAPGLRPHIWLVVDDSKREIAQPVDVEAVQADGAAAPAALGADRPNEPTVEPGGAFEPTRIAGDLPTSAGSAWNVAIVRACHPAVERHRLDRGTPIRKRWEAAPGRVLRTPS
jgi:uncharacterized membrane protein